MSFLIRKITRSKWMQNDIISSEDISADAITNCMKTTLNTLSTWEVSEEDYIPDAVLAIVSSYEHLDMVDVVCLKRNSLESSGLKLESTEGQTPVRDLVNNHIDICGLTYQSLGIVAKQIVEEIRADNVIRYTKAGIRKLINSAINQGQFQKEDLAESLRNKL